MKVTDEMVEKAAKAIWNCRKSSILSLGADECKEWTRRRLIYFMESQHALESVLGDLPEVGVLYEWQPIETCPKDGTHFIAFANGYQYVMRNGSFGLHLITTPSQCLPPYKPTYWMPLFAAPTPPNK